MGGIAEIVNSHESWLASPAGACVENRIHELLDSILRLEGGERLLDVGCVSGNHLTHFMKMGCRVTGMETSRPFLEAARTRIGERADIHLGDFEDLPFSDDEFDVVLLVGSLEGARDPQKALREAVRVSRGRVCIGLYNRISLAAHHLSASGLLRPRRNSFGIYEVINMVRSIFPAAPLKWGSVIYFPLWCYPWAAGMDKKLPMIKNPIGSFAAISFPVSYTHRTIQEPLRVQVKAGLRKNSRVPGTVCNNKGDSL